jgi:hypothetical protein
MYVDAVDELTENLEIGKHESDEETETEETIEQ